MVLLILKSPSVFVSLDDPYISYMGSNTPHVPGSHAFPPVLKNWVPLHNKHSSLFVYIFGNVKLFMLIYVDDILTTCTHLQHINTLIHKLGKFFSMKDLGPLHYYLGIEA